MILIMVGDKSPVSKSFRSLFSGVSCLVNRRVASGGGSRWDDHSLHGALKCATNFYPASKIFSARISNACVSASDSSLPHEQVENFVENVLILHGTVRIIAWGHDNL